MSQQQSQGSGGGSQGSSLGFLWVILAVFAMGAVVWYLFHTQIILGILYLKLGEIWLINFFTDSLQSVYGWILQANPAKVTIGQVGVIASAVGDYIRIPAFIILSVLAWYTYTSDIRLKFKRTYDMTALANAEKNNWPQITPVLDVDLVNEDIDEGQWAMALTPLQFVKKYRLITLQQAKNKHKYKSQLLPPTMEIIENRTNMVFASQLGRPWMGIDSLPTYAKALFAIFASRIDRNTDEARSLLKQIAVSTQSGQLDFTGTDVLLDKHRHLERVKQLTSQHAYELTTMASMLQAAREDGVLASAEFLWLKPVDRKLWYVLNGVGRRTVFCETAGTHAHWLAECALKRPLRSPMVTQATRGLALALETIIYTESENEPTPKALTAEAEPDLPYSGVL